VVSFFAVGEPATGVTTSGLRYPLRDSRLELGAQDSVSNVVDAVPASITIGRGELLVIVNR
jgi:thiamine pyrophosphokinase